MKYLMILVSILITVVPALAAKEIPKIAVWDLAAKNISADHASILTSILVSEVNNLKKYEVISFDNIRAGTSSEYELVDYAWYDKNSGNRTNPVGQKRPNGLGLYDMSGNVWEWCQDWYDKDYYSRKVRDNPEGLIVVNTGCFVAVPGAVDRGSFAPRAGPGSNRRAGAAATAFVWFCPLNNFLAGKCPINSTKRWR